MSVSWNLWHGCHKHSEGCKHCYVYRGDAKRKMDSSVVHKTKRFAIITARKKSGEYKIPGGQMVYTCFTSDFFLEDADSWRIEAWEMIRERRDLRFFFITKRIERFLTNLPEDWGDGYDHVIIGCTVENQRCADFRLPLFRELPLKHRVIICEPLLEAIDLIPYLDDKIEQVVVGGESGPEARLCDFAWVVQLRDQCLKQNVSFHFKQTGSNFLKDGVLYKIAWKDMHSQARKAGIKYTGRFAGYI
jgi:protein gp37